MPLLVAERRNGALVITAVDRAALALGLRPGLALADARARVPHAEVQEADPAADAALLEVIADGC
ncbi:MAG TPA: DNA polymerase Y family protein, partial [Xanthobacteraceae bacterium]|nr:DNA polymerase Y family protein [Xanthobacteraceae bacterium]